MRRHVDRGHALEAVFQIPGVVPVDVGRPHVVAFFDSRPLVKDPESTLAVGIDDVGIARLGNRRSRLAAPGVDDPPGARVLDGAGREARHGDGRIIILLTGIEPVGILVIDFHLVELGRGLVELGRPGLAPVVAHVGSPVVGLDQLLRVCRIDPDVVVVPVGNAHLFPGLSPIDRLEDGVRVGVHNVGVGRVQLDVGVVEGSVDQPLVVRDLFERPALVN